MSRRSALVGAVCVAVAATAAVLAVGFDGSSTAKERLHRQGLQHVSLPPLPAGAPRLHAFHALIQTVPPHRIVPSATSVFAGIPIAKGGSEVVAPTTDESGFAVTAHQIRFKVDHVFRGPRVDAIDITALDAEGLDPFLLGTRYVVFAEQRTFGTEAAPRLATVGYWQGAFRVQNAARPQVATNGRGDHVATANPLAGVVPGQ